MSRKDRRSKDEQDRREDRMTGADSVRDGDSPSAPPDRERADHDSTRTRDSRPEDTNDSGDARGSSRDRRDRDASPEERAQDYLDQLQRLKAEFDNYRKRMIREREEWFQSVQADTVRRFLSVIDDLRRAREHFRPDEAPDAEGLLMILKRFEDILAQLGLEEQNTEPGTEFDPEEHEAVLASPSESIAEGRIVQTIEPGYLFHGRLLRPGKVCVSSGPTPE